MKRTLIAFMLAATSIVAIAPAAAAAGSIEQVTLESAAVIKGDAVWINVLWRGSGDDITNLRLVSDTDGVGYPANTPGFTGLTDGLLTDNELDYTAIKLTVDSEEDAKKMLVEGEVTYEQGGEEFEIDFELTVPLVKYKGDDLEQLTESSDVSLTGEGEWVDVKFAGLAPRLDNFRMEIRDADGLTLEYPGMPGGSRSSLHANDVLEDNETDVTRFYFVNTGESAGSHTLKIRVTYDYKGKNHKYNSELVLNLS